MYPPCNVRGTTKPRCIAEANPVICPVSTGAGGHAVRVRARAICRECPRFASFVRAGATVCLQCTCVGVWFTEVNPFFCPVTTAGSRG